jgi:Family of unknown function (DUF5681)
MTPEKTIQKQPGFQPGKSGNPAGRPKGALNRSTVAALAMLEGEAEALTRKVVELALAGDVTALRLCLERLVPPVKERAIPAGAVTLPKLSNDTANAATAEVVEAVANGRITPTEGERLCGLLVAHRRANQTATPSEMAHLHVIFMPPKDTDSPNIDTAFSASSPP